MGQATEEIVRYAREDAVATIVMDDGKGNVISPEMLRQLNRALDRAESAGAVVILTGAGDIFCGGFDLKVLETGVRNAFQMLIGGFQLSKRLLSFPWPVVIACNGHAYAMGSFLLLSGDYRVGVEGDVKITANEVKIGLTMPHSAIEICRQRLKPAHLDRAALLSEVHNPESAVQAGFLDALVSKEDLRAEARQLAESLASLDLKAHRQSKLRLRRDTLQALGWAIQKDKLDFVLMGLRRALGRK